MSDASSSTGMRRSMDARRYIDEQTRDSTGYYGRAVHLVNGWLTSWGQPATELTANFVVNNVRRTDAMVQSITSSHWRETAHFAYVGLRTADPIPIIGSFANLLGGFVNPQTIDPGSYRQAFTGIGLGDDAHDFRAVQRALLEERTMVDRALVPSNFRSSGV